MFSQLPYLIYCNPIVSYESESIFKIMTNNAKSHDNYEQFLFSSHPQIWNMIIVRNSMLQRVLKELQVLEIQKNTLTTLTQSELTPATLQSFTVSLKSIHTITEILTSGLLDILTLEQIKAIITTQGYALSCAFEQISVLTPHRQKNQQRQKETLICGLCTQNIHENNIKEAKIGLEKDHRQKFHMAMEQFNRLSQQQTFTKEEESFFENELYKQLSHKEKVFNLKTTRMEEFITLMESTLTSLQGIRDFEMNETVAVKASSKITSIDSFVSEVLKSSFSKKIPPWIHKTFAKLISMYRQISSEKQIEKSTQTPAFKSDEMKELAREKASVEKQLRKVSKELEELKMCYGKMQKMNKELSKDLSLISREIKLRNMEKPMTKKTLSKNSSKQNSMRDIKLEQPGNEGKQQNIERSYELMQSLLTDLNEGSQKRRSNQSSLLPKIKPTRNSESNVLNDNRFKPFSDKQFQLASLVHEKIKKTNNKDERKQSSKNNGEPFVNEILEQNGEIEFEDYVSGENDQRETHRAGREKPLKQAIIMEDKYENDNETEKYIDLPMGKSKKSLMKKSVKVIKNAKNNDHSSNNSLNVKKQLSLSKRKNSEQKTGVQSNSKRNSHLKNESDRIKKDANQNDHETKTVRGDTKEMSVKQNLIEEREMKRVESVSSELETHAKELTQKVYRQSIEQESPKRVKHNSIERSNSIGEYVSFSHRNKSKVRKHSVGIQTGMEDQTYYNRTSSFCSEEPACEIGNQRTAKTKDNFSLKNNKMNPLKSNIRLDYSSSLPHIHEKSRSKSIHLKDNGKEKSQHKKDQTSILSSEQKQGRKQLEGLQIFGKKVFKKLKDMHFIPLTMQYEEFQKLMHENSHHKEHQTLEITNIFNGLFINKKQALKYEESLQQTYHKKIIEPLDLSQKNVCDQIFKMIISLRTDRKEAYQQVSAILRLPYQTFFNNLKFISFVSEMQDHTFELYFRRILRIHKKCQKGSSGKCEHLQTVIHQLKSLSNDC